MITTTLISTWKLTSNDEGSRVEAGIHLNVKNTYFFVGERTVGYYYQATFFPLYVIKQAPGPASSCVRASVMTTIQLVAPKMLVKSNLK